MKHYIKLIMLAFAGASLFNVKAFLVGAGHPVEVAWVLGVALGASLVAVSIMLTDVDKAHDRQGFYWLLGTGALLGAISGSLQTAEYAKHLGPVAAGLLGFGIPLGGEVCLAVAFSLFAKGKDRERFRNVATVIEGAVADQLEAAIAEFDPALVRKHMDRTIVNLSRLAIDSVAGHAAQFYAPPSAGVDAQPYTMPVQMDAQPDTGRTQDRTEHRTFGEMDAQTDGTPYTTVERANDARRTKAQARQEELLQILRTEYDGRPADDLNKTEVGARLGTTRQTISRDLEALAAANRVTVNGVVKVH